MTRPFSMGIALWPQQTTWAAMMESAELADELGFEHIWTIDHWLAPHGDPDQSCFDGWAVLSGWATRTRSAKLSLFVGANTFRSPTAAAKLATTLDHQSGGRAMLGLGAGWFEREHEAYGIDFGNSPGERIGWLSESAGIARRLLDGESVTVTEGHYRVDDLRLLPRPIQARMPIVIGGSGEKKTLRVVAEYADMWNAFGSPAFLQRKIAILGEHCTAVGRDLADIELTLGAMPLIRDSRADAESAHQARLDANKITPANTIIGPDGLWLGSVDDVVARIEPYRELGITSVIVEMPAPFDEETIRRLATEVMPRIRD